MVNRALRSIQQKISAAKRQRIREGQQGQQQQTAAAGGSGAEPGRGGTTIPLTPLGDTLDTLGMLPGQRPDTGAQQALLATDGAAGAAAPAAASSTTGKLSNANRTRLHDLVLAEAAAAAQRPGRPDVPAAGSAAAPQTAAAPHPPPPAPPSSQDRLAPGRLGGSARAQSVDVLPAEDPALSVMRPFQEFLERYRKPESTRDGVNKDGNVGADDLEDQHTLDRFLDALLARQPYWESLPDYARDPDQMEALADLQPVSAAQVAQALRAPAGPTERGCVLGAGCQGRRLQHRRGPVTLREWVAPGDSPGPEPGPCLLCVHYLVTRAWLRRRNRDQDGGGGGGVLQPHYYLVDQPGEYRAGTMIQSTKRDAEGLLRPFRLHVLSDFYEDPSDDGPPGFLERAEVFFH